MRNTAARRAMAILLAGALSCRDADTPDTEPGFVSTGRRVAGVVVIPSATTIAPGGAIELVVEPRDRRHRKVSGVTFTWTSSTPSVARVSASGVVTGVSAGSVTITATGGGTTGTAEITVQEPPPPLSGPVLLAAGDIARCASLNDEATAALLDGLPGTIAVLGDNAYEDGTLVEYTDCYGPSWGRHKSRTRPALGNHEYHTRGAAGYYEYFGAAAGDRREGYYSYDLGDWHIVVLNSNCSVVSCAAGSAQERWLRADLAAHPAKCTLAYFHHPRFSSGATHGNNASVLPLWQALYDGGAEIVLSAHEHVYERFAPQTPAGEADASRGVRQFTVGTGGRALYKWGTIKANSEVRNNATFGVLELTLGAESYSWRFVPVAGGRFTDTGSGVCH